MIFGFYKQEVELNTEMITKSFKFLLVCLTICTYIEYWYFMKIPLKRPKTFIKVSKIMENHQMFVEYKYVYKVLVNIWPGV